jgi:6-phosphogluconolactonase (cycloisomerase 2 family)
LTLVDLQRNGTYNTEGLQGAASVALSPDSAHVYGTGRTDDALAVFEVIPIPEPAGTLMLASGIAFLAALDRGKRTRRRRV